jgi:ketosteroid isomerase-like protein
MTNAKAGGSTEEVLARHWRDFQAGDVEAIMADYAADAVLISTMGTLKGHAQIREAFGSIFSHLFPPGASTLKLEKQVVEGETAYIVWSGSAPKFDVPFATDTFWIRDGKIAVQTFAAKMDKK